MRTRGAQAWVRKTPTGFPLCTSIVSSSPSVVRVRTSASYAAQLRAARPVPPYTTRSSGRSAFSGSRLFISIRSGASVCHDRAVSVLPRGARTGRAPSIADRLSVAAHATAAAARRGRSPPHSGGVHAAQFALELADLVAQPRRDLELQFAGRVQHLLVELLDQVGQLGTRHR